MKYIFCDRILELQKYKVNRMKVNIAIIQVNRVNRMEMKYI